jgi:flagellar FliJ protein
MNRRLAQLLLLLELKKEVTQKAYVEVLKAKELFDQNKLRHTQLAGFRMDYVQQIETLGKEGTYIDRVKTRVSFINHLDVALMDLNNLLAQLAKSRAQAEIKYRQAKIAEEGVVKLIERAQKEEDLKTQRREQKESDEFAQKQWYGKKNNE